MADTANPVTGPLEAGTVLQGRYAIERLQALGLSRFWAAAVPLLIFSVGHLTSGWPNIIAALLVGSVLAIFYQWRRDLLANMIGHFLVDFIGVVVPRFFS